MQYPAHPLAAFRGTLFSRIMYEINRPKESENFTTLALYRRNGCRFIASQHSALFITYL